jgi:hypothetical protein
MLTRLCESDDLVCDDVSHPVINIAFERERVADLVKCGAHRLNVRGIDMVLGEWHRDVSPAHGTWKFAIFSGQLSIIATSGSSSNRKNARHNNPAPDVPRHLLGAVKAA